MTTTRHGYLVIDIYRPVVIPATMSTTRTNQWTSTKQCSAITRDGMYPWMTISPDLQRANHSPPGNASVISVKQYAIRQGVSQQAIYRRISRGQLGDAVIHRGGRYWIDANCADAAWAKHGRPCNSKAAQIETRLMALADDLAREVVGQSPEYCTAAVWRMVDQVLAD